MASGSVGVFFFSLSPEVVLGYWERENNEEQIALINNVFIVQSVG